MQEEGRLGAVGLRLDPGTLQESWRWALQEVG